MTERDRAAFRRLADVNASLAVREASAGHQKFLNATARAAGFDYYMVALFPRGDITSFSGNSLFTNWPNDIVKFYGESDVFHYSKLVERLKRTILPVFFDGSPFASAAANHETKQLNDVFALRGLQTTLAFSLHDADLKQYVFTFSGRRAAVSREQGMDILFKCMEMLEELSGPGDADDGPQERLSRREIECLRWSAAGKSSDEIAIILDLSSHTVAGYLKSAMRKLDSVNRMQAVARAFRYRLL